MNQALTLFFRIKFRNVNKAKVIKNVRTRGVVSSVFGTSSIFSEYNKMIGNIVNKNGKITNLVLIENIE